MANQVLSLQELPTLNNLDLGPLEFGPTTPTCTFCSVTCFNTASDNEEMP